MGTRIRNYSQIRGSSIKIPCIVSTTAGITLSGTQSIDGYNVGINQRVLVKDQSTAYENGIYISGTSSWVRANDMSTDEDLFKGLVISVNNGTSNQDTLFKLTSDDPLIIGSSSLTFELIPTLTDGSVTLIKLADLYKKRVDAVISGTYIIDYNAGDIFQLLLNGDTAITETNLPTGTDTKDILIIMTGSFVPTFPVYWTLIPSSDAYDGSVDNLIVVSVINGTSGSEKVFYRNENVV